MKQTIIVRVTAEITVENTGDLWDAMNGRIADGAVRRMTIPDALVDTRATLLSLPRSTIEQLGLWRVATKRIIASSGPTEAGMYEAVRLTIMGRSCTMEATIAASAPASNASAR